MTTPSDTHHLFGTDAPTHTEEATRSWWVDAETRESFTAAMQREEARMRRSRVGKSIHHVPLGWSHGISGGFR